MELLKERIRREDVYKRQAVVHRTRPRGRFGSFAAMGKGTRRPQAAKFPDYKTYSQIAVAK